MVFVPGLGDGAWDCLGGVLQVYGERAFGGGVCFFGTLACLHVAVQNSMVLNMFLAWLCKA